MRFKYIIGDSIGSPAESANNELVIFKILDNVSIVFATPTVRIYDTLEDLTNKDALFNSLSNSEKKRLLMEENIQTITGLVFVPKSKERPTYTGQFIQHVMFGDVFNQKVLGIHHISGLKSGLIEINKWLSSPDKNGVYKVELRRRDGRHNRDKNIKEWRHKEASFFPDEWDWWRLYEECEFAFDNKSFVSSKGTNLLWTSFTKSNVPVEIYTDKNENFKTIYPLFLEML